MSRVDQDEAAIRHRVAADLNYLPIRAGSFEAQFLVGVFEAAAEFRVDVDGVKFAPLRRGYGGIQHSSDAQPEELREGRAICWKLRFHAANRRSSSNIATPSAMLSKVTRNSA